MIAKRKAKHARRLAYFSSGIRATRWEEGEENEAFTNCRVLLTLNWDEAFDVAVALLRAARKAERVGDCVQVYLPKGGLRIPKQGRNP